MSEVIKIGLRQMGVDGLNRLKTYITRRLDDTMYRELEGDSGAFQLIQLGRQDEFESILTITNELLKEMS